MYDDTMLDDVVDDVFLDACAFVDDSDNDAFDDDGVDDADVINSTASDNVVSVANVDAVCNNEETMIERHDVNCESRDTDIEEKRKVDAFLQQGCGCKYFDGHQCSSAFTRDHLCSIRDQCTAMTRPALQNIIFGHVMATVRTSVTIESRGHPSKDRERNRTSFMHEGMMVYS